MCADVIQSRYRENTIQRVWRSKLLSGLAYDPDIAYGTDSSVVLGSAKTILLNASEAAGKS